MVGKFSIPEEVFTYQRNILPYLESAYGLYNFKKIYIKPLLDHFSLAFLVKLDRFDPSRICLLGSNDCRVAHDEDATQLGKG